MQLSTLLLAATVGVASVTAEIIVHIKNDAPKGSAPHIVATTETIGAVKRALPTWSPQLQNCRPNTKKSSPNKTTTVKITTTPSTTPTTTPSKTTTAATTTSSAAVVVGKCDFPAATQSCSINGSTCSPRSDCNTVPDEATCTALMVKGDFDAADYRPESGVCVLFNNCCPLYL